MKNLTLIFLFFCSPLLADTPSLTVSGQATLKKPADYATITVGVVTEAEDAQNALEDNNEKMHAVINAILKFDQDNLQHTTGTFSISPQYTQRPQKAPENWKASILGYQVTNTIAISTSLIKQVGEIIDAVNQAGVNTIRSVQFSLKDPRDYRKEAIKQATSFALDDAKTLAEAADVKLAKLLSISLDQPQIHPPPMIKAAAFSARAENAPPIEAGDVEVSAMVHVVFEIS